MTKMQEDPKEILDVFLEDILLKNFPNNEYFKFNDFARRAKSLRFKQSIDYDVMRDFLYKMLDENKVEQVYINEKANPFLESKDKKIKGEKSIHFKVIV